MENKLKHFIEDYEGKVSELEKKKHLAYFEAAVTGDPKHFNTYASLEVEHAKILSDASDFSFLESVQKRSAWKDPLLKRQAEVLFLTYKAHQLPSDLQEEIIRLESHVDQQFSVFRAEVGGKMLTDNQVEDVLEQSTSSRDVEEAWSASKMVGSVVEKDVRHLVTLRNKGARMLGFSDYHRMSLQLSEQDPLQVDAMFDRLDSLTAKGFASEKKKIDNFLAGKFGLEASQLRPWHYQDRFFQEAPKIAALNMDPYYSRQDLAALTSKYFGDIGLPVDDLLERSDLYEKPGKNQHAFCIHIDRRGDVRVLCNVRPNKKWMNTMLHEYGHAVYEKFFSDELPFVLREAAHIFTTEAVAMFFGRMASDPLWLHHMGLMDAESSKAMELKAKEVIKMEQLVFSRWAQVMYRFEQAMYARPDQDLNVLWWKLVQKFQGLTPPHSLNVAHWASKIHVATAPCYYHNYLLGELLASQFYASHSGDLHSEQMGRFFREKVFAPGASLPWDQMIRQATGEELDPKFYAREHCVG